MSFSRFSVAGLGDLGIGGFYGFGFSVQGLGLRVCGFVGIWGL